MKYIKYIISIYIIAAFSSAHAAGEVVQSCSGYGPYGNIIPGWALISIKTYAAGPCGIPSSTQYTWKNINGYPYGSREIVCSFENLPNWWPIQYIRNTSPAQGPCNGAAYTYLVEYRGN
jgi:hypothetical protein